MKKFIFLPICLLLCLFCFAGCNQKDDKQNVSDLVANAIENIEAQDYQKAIDNYSLAIEISNDQADLYAARANCYAQIENYDLAIQDYQKAINLNAENEQYYLDLYHLYLDNDQDEAALSIIEQGANATNSSTLKEILEEINDPIVDPNDAEDRIASSFDGSKFNFDLSINNVYVPTANIQDLAKALNIDVMKNNYSYYAYDKDYAYSINQNIDKNVFFIISFDPTKNPDYWPYSDIANITENHCLEDVLKLVGYSDNEIKYLLTKTELELVDRNNRWSAEIHGDSTKVEVGKYFRLALYKNDLNFLFEFSDPDQDQQLELVYFSIINER